MGQPLYLFKIEQDERNGWDTYSAAVVAATSPADAARLHPNESEIITIPVKQGHWYWPNGTWTDDPSLVTVTLLGPADPSIERGVIVASFHAG